MKRVNPSGEEWRDVPGYVGMYQVSDRGRVRSLDRIDCAGRSLSGKVRKLRVNAAGYHTVVLHADGKGKDYFVHRLVAEAFCNPPENTDDHEVNHVNFDPLCNRPHNLEWVQPHENRLHSARAGRCKSARKSSRFVGVTWHKQVGKWQASLKTKGKNHYLGLFTDEEQAAAAYDRAVLKFYGDPAFTNASVEAA